MIKTNVFTQPLNIQRLKLTSMVTTNFICGKTCKSMVFVTIARSTYSTREKREGNTMWGHWSDINLLSQMFSNIETCVTKRRGTQGNRQCMCYLLRHPDVHTPQVDLTTTDPLSYPKHDLPTFSLPDLSHSQDQQTQQLDISNDTYTSI
jgi:hypothetical protein